MIRSDPIRSDLRDADTVRSHAAVELRGLFPFDADANTAVCTPSILLNNSVHSMAVILIIFSIPRLVPQRPSHLITSTIASNSRRRLETESRMTADQQSDQRETFLQAHSRNDRGFDCSLRLSLSLALKLDLTSLQIFS